MSNLSIQPQSVTVIENGAAQTRAPEAKKKGFGFGDFLDVINPLHHIPVVGQIYRAVTGDQISDKARLAGGGLFAGPLGIGIAAGTIAARGGEAEPTTAPHTPQPLQAAPQGYQALAAQRWTPETLAALSQSIQGSAQPADLKHSARDEEPRPERAPVPRVESKALPAAPLMTQMLSNLEKYEALRPEAR